MFYQEELLDLIRNKWTVEQLDHYIESLEERIKENHELLKEVKQIRRRKTKKQVYDNGPRGGM